MGRAFKYHTAWLIDDNYIDNAIHQKILESCHFAENILVFESAKLAIDYTNHIDPVELTEPIIVFLDLRMPELDGYAFLTELEKLPAAMLSKIKIYVLSSSLDPSDRRKIKKNQLTHCFISKPLTTQVLVKL